jgi:hypothetical protein
VIFLIGLMLVLVLQALLEVHDGILPLNLVAPALGRLEDNLLSSLGVRDA